MKLIRRILIIIILSGFWFTFEDIHYTQAQTSCPEKEACNESVASEYNSCIFVANVGYSFCTSLAQTVYDGCSDDVDTERTQCEADADDEEEAGWERCADWYYPFDMPGYSSCEQDVEWEHSYAYSYCSYTAYEEGLSCSTTRSQDDSACILEGFADDNACDQTRSDGYIACDSITCP